MKLTMKTKASTQHRPQNLRGGLTGNQLEQKGQNRTNPGATGNQMRLTTMRSRTMVAVGGNGCTKLNNKRLGSRLTSMSNALVSMLSSMSNTVGVTKTVGG